MMREVLRMVMQAILISIWLTTLLQRYAAVASSGEPAMSSDKSVSGLSADRDVCRDEDGETGSSLNPLTPSNELHTPINKKGNNDKAKGPRKKMIKGSDNKSDTDESQYDGLPDSSSTEIAKEAFEFGYINIDCGTSEPHRTLNMSYDTDDKYIATGSNMPINSEFLYDDLDPVYKTVRSFPDGERNCYTLKPANGRDHNYLIRAMFMYGNYDGKNSTPSFDVYIGVNFWRTIELQSAQDKRFIEILHKPTTDFIYLCLVNIGKGTPFISELVLRPLDNSLYNVSEFALLHTRVRYDTGIAAENSGYTSYADDVYDRFWSPLPHNNFPSWKNYSRDPDLSSLRNDAYRLPPTIFKTGARPRAGKRSLNFFYPPSNSSDEFYFYLHFAETQKIRNKKVRELSVFIDGNPISKPINLRYLEALTLASSRVKLAPNNSYIWLSINQTETSSLPPILNAMEVYLVKELPQSATNQDDANAIMDVKTRYGANGTMKSWQGDPCLPKLPWDGLNCSDNGNDSPRITSLNLSSRSLRGEILPSLFSLKSLNYLDLSNNSLTGTIPEFLANMSSLRVIDLRGNNLSGSVPSALTARANTSSLSLRLEDNPNLCISDRCSETRTSEKHKVLVPVAQLLLCLCFSLLLLVQ